MKEKIIARIIVEVLGSPKEHVETTIKEIITKLETESGIRMIKQRTYEAEEQKGTKLWSTFSEVEFQAEGLKNLTEICFNYMPSSIEIIEPAGMDIDLSVVSDFMNDLLARIHKYDMILKNLHAENMVMKHDINLIKEAAKAAIGKKIAEKTAIEKKNKK